MKPGPDTFVVRINQFYSSSEGLREYTVVLKRDSPIRSDALVAARQYVFFATPLVYATSLALQGEATRKTSKTVRVASGRSNLLLADRIRRAETIVRGTRDQYSQPRLATARRVRAFRRPAKLAHCEVAGSPHCGRRLCQTIATISNDPGKLPNQQRHPLVQRATVLPKLLGVPI